MQSKSGFTIVELIVSIVIIGILATVSIFSFLKVQQQAHDNQRTTSATLISDSLEKYFEVNGEYPSVFNMTNSDPNAVKTMLGLNNLDSLTNAGTGTSSTNVWKSGTPGPGNLIVYSGNNDATSTCNSTTVSGGVCTDYKIQYYKEDTGTVETIYSRNKSSGVSSSVASNQQIAPPAMPTLTVGPSGSNVVATASVVTCQPGATPQYAFLSRTNNGSWTTGAWTNSNTTSTVTAQGTKYGYQVKAQCLLSGVGSPPSATTAEKTLTTSINTPGTVTLTNSSTANTTTWSWSAVACPSGTTTYYSIASGNDYNTTGAQNWWMGWSADQTGTSWARDTTSQGYNYAAKAKVKCANAFAVSNWSAESNTSTYLRPVAAPGLASGWSYAPVNGRTEFDWWWVEPACGQGTARSFQWDGYIGDVNNANGWNMYWSDKGPYNHYWYGATAPSFQDPGWYTGNSLGLQFNGASTAYGVDVYARILYRCQNPDTQRTAVGSWSQSPGYST
jgi:prepilin-type N-terminal cleavage/methylation domain-containing protein